uniref:Uncharacterized protein n=1 Tax=Tetranychus urticae TaxID=32264 RepID=T1L675_TETUR
MVVFIISSLSGMIPSPGNFPFSAITEPNGRTNPFLNSTKDSLIGLASKQ